MKKIGVVYAISRTAGDHCKKLINANSENKVEIVTHECPSDAYKAAANDLNKIAGLLLESIEFLHKNGAEVIIIAANSVHRAFAIANEQVKQKFPKIKLVSIVDAAVAETVKMKFQTISIFGSNSTIKSDIYQNKLNDQKITTVPLGIDDQDFIHSLISSGISPDTIKEDMKQEVIKIADRLKKSGCEAIILACTELPIIFNTNNLKISVIDTNLILALAAIAAATQHKDLACKMGASYLGDSIRSKL